MSEPKDHCLDCKPDIDVMCTDAKCPCHNPLSVIVEDQYGVSDIFGKLPPPKE